MPTTHAYRVRDREGRMLGGGTTYPKNTECDQPSAPTGSFTATGWQ